MARHHRYREEEDLFDEAAAGEHMKAMWAGQSKVLVAVRVRPLMRHDRVQKPCVRVLDGNVVVIMDPGTGLRQNILRVKRTRERQYAFDFVFHQNSGQQSLYLNTTKFLIHGVLDGYNATVFAYGQTGSGKTYTMIGTQEDPGIMVRVMQDLFRHASNQGKQQGVQYRVTVSFLEVYNENIRDLLSETEEYLDLREDPIKGPVVAGITEVEANSSDEIMSLLHQGNGKRSQAATAANEVSSRSHAVLQVVVECRDRAPGVVANIKVGKLSLVDLAGSERAANTKNTGVRLVEGANINRSLLALGNCIKALGEKGKGNFVPYRDSKLTRLLKDSLGGNCRTVMIANISSADSSFEETLNTLKYANRAKNIKTTVQRNVLNVNYHISEYVQLINNLRGEIKVLKDQIGMAPANFGGLDDSGDLYEPSQPGVAVRRGAHQAKLQALSGSPSRTAATAHRQPSTPLAPLDVLRESMRSSASRNHPSNEGREHVMNMRQRIVENFQERMQLRRSLIELDDKNVQNSIEVSKRQLLVVQWTGASSSLKSKNKQRSPNNTCTGTSFEDTNEDGKAEDGSDNDENIAAQIETHAPLEVKEAWTETEQLRKAIAKNNLMKKSIANRLRLNEAEAEEFRDELSNNITGEDRRELMELQYQVGRLELENMELEQHRIVHESIVKGKDLIIQKLRLQLAVKDKVIQHQQRVLTENGLQDSAGLEKLAALQQSIMTDTEWKETAAPPSPPRTLAELYTQANDFRASRGAGLSSAIPGAPMVPVSEPVDNYDESENDEDLALDEQSKSEFKAFNEKEDSSDAEADAEADFIQEGSDDESIESETSFGNLAGRRNKRISQYRDQPEKYEKLSEKYKDGVKKSVAAAHVNGSAVDPVDKLDIGITGKGISQSQAAVKRGLNPRKGRKHRAAAAAAARAEGREGREAAMHGSLGALGPAAESVAAIAAGNVLSHNMFVAGSGNPNINPNAGVGGAYNNDTKGGINQDYLQHRAQQKLLRKQGQGQGQGQGQVAMTTPRSNDDFNTDTDDNTDTSLGQVKPTNHNIAKRRHRHERNEHSRLEEEQSKYNSDYVAFNPMTKYDKQASRNNAANTNMNSRPNSSRSMGMQNAHDRREREAGAGAGAGGGPSSIVNPNIVGDRNTVGDRGFAARILHAQADEFPQPSVSSYSSAATERNDLNWRSSDRKSYRGDRDRGGGGGLGLGAAGRPGGLGGAAGEGVNAKGGVGKALQSTSDKDIAATAIGIFPRQTQAAQQGDRYERVDNPKDSLFADEPDGTENEDANHGVGVLGSNGISNRDSLRDRRVDRDRDREKEKEHGGALPGAGAEFDGGIVGLGIANSNSSSSSNTGAGAGAGGRKASGGYRHGKLLVRAHTSVDVTEGDREGNGIAVGKAAVERAGSSHSGSRKSSLPQNLPSIIK